MSAPRRRLTVILSADAAGFTSMLSQNEAATLRALGSIKERIVGPLLDEFRGTLFKTMGDGALIEFLSVTDAASFAIAFQGKVAERNRRASVKPQFRIGIALAETLEDGDDRHGAGIAFATRVQEAAPVGGILMSHSARWQLSRPLIDEFHRTEVRRLKGLNERFELWVWTPDGRPSDYRLPPEELSTHVLRGNPAAPQTDPYLVVLPLRNLTGSRANDMLAEGFVDEIMAALSRASGFSVVSRRFTEAYDSNTDARTIALELGARYMLAGSLRMSGDLIRVTLDLSHSQDRAQLWSERLDGRAADAFVLQEKVASLTAGTLHTVIRAAEIERAARKGESGLDAHDYILRALPAFWSHVQVANETSIALFERALALEPRNALAMAFKAWGLAQRVTYVWSSEPLEDAASALRLAETAAEIGPDDAMVLTAAGAAFSMLRPNQRRAFGLIRKALSIDSYLSWAWLRLGYAHVYAAQPTDAVASFERAIALSPLDPIKFNAYAGLGAAYFDLQDYARAQEHVTTALEHKPGLIWAQRLLATAAAHAGDLETAREAVARLRASSPGMSIARLRTALPHLSGDMLERYLRGLRMAGMPEEAEPDPQVIRFSEQRGERSAR